MRVRALAVAAAARARPRVGAVAALAMPRAGALAARNLELCFPELDDAARERCCANTSPRWASACSNSPAPGGAASSRCAAGLRIEGLEHLQPRAPNGRGVHRRLRPLHDAGDLRPPAVRPRPARRHVPPAPEPAMEWAVKQGRLRYAVAMFTNRGMRAAVRHLKRGGVLWYAPDQDMRGNDTVFVPFFGQPAATYRRPTSSRGCRVRRCSFPRRRDEAVTRCGIVAGARRNSRRGRDRRHRARHGRDRSDGARGAGAVPVDPPPLQAPARWQLALPLIVARVPPSRCASSTLAYLRKA